MNQRGWEKEVKFMARGVKENMDVDVESQSPWLKW